ncbi:MAG: nucleoside kinase [Polyangiaceae bacterium]
MNPSTSGRGSHADRRPAGGGATRVVAARVRNRTSSLDENVGPREMELVTLADWEGREIFARSAGLVALEAVRRAGRGDARLGSSWATGREVVVRGLDAATAADLAARATAELVAMVASGEVLREESWPIDDAIELLRGEGQEDAALLLELSTSPRVALATCGGRRFPSGGVMVPDARLLDGIALVPHPAGLALDYGVDYARELAPRPVATLMLEVASPRYRAEMTVEEQRWLDLLGITSVGSLTRACVSGAVRDLVHVAEAFHEKRIANIADAIRTQSGVRVIAVAGPSSSGKTTFLKRLAIQLQIIGVRPVTLSLDDYYVDREKTVREPDGTLDFEALEALDLELLREHVADLVSGRPVTTARFDFIEGKSHPQGGATLRLGPSDVLLIEGIHALNPALLPNVDRDAQFKVFLQPATALAFDALTTFEPIDLRLVRRIVRDRHDRGYSAEQSLARWEKVRQGERLRIEAFLSSADRVFDTALVYEIGVLKVFAERYLLEVPRTSKQFPRALRLRTLLQPFVPIHPEYVPPNSVLREFIGGSSFR